MDGLCILGQASRHQAREANDACAEHTAHTLYRYASPTDRERTLVLIRFRSKQSRSIALHRFLGTSRGRKRIWLVVLNETFKMEINDLIFKIKK